MNKAISVIFGVFITTIVFTVFTKNFPDTTGIILALVFLGIINFFGFFFSKKGSYPRMISWGSSVMTIAGIILFFVLKFSFEHFMTGF